MSECPGEAALRLLGTDTLGDWTYTAIEQHVEGCPKCKAFLERLAHRGRDSTVVLPGPERWPSIPGFEMQSELGRGAMGVVYLAIETGLDRPVALKSCRAPWGRTRAPALAAAGCARHVRYRASRTPTSCRSMISERRMGVSSWCSNTSPAVL
jgi:eukaryotic-like serine/threonine-protein kinase